MSGLLTRLRLAIHKAKVRESECLAVGFAHQSAAFQKWQVDDTINRMTNIELLEALENMDLPEPPEDY